MITEAKKLNPDWVTWAEGIKELELAMKKYSSFSGKGIKAKKAYDEAEPSPAMYLD